MKLSLATSQLPRLLLLVALLLSQVVLLEADDHVVQTPYHGSQPPIVKPPPVIVKPPIVPPNGQPPHFVNGQDQEHPLLGLNPANNRPIPEFLAMEIASLLVLEDVKSVPESGARFAVNAQLYTSLLNLFATDDQTARVMYTDQVSEYIVCSRTPYDIFHQDKYHYSYSVKNGQEKVLLGYSECLSATRFRDILCRDQTEDYTLDANVDSNQRTYLWVHFTTAFRSMAANLSATAYEHYQWIDGTGSGRYYDFYATQYQNNDGDFHHSLTGNIWIGSVSDNYPTHDWTVTGSKYSGLTIFDDGGYGILVVPPEPNPEEPVPQPQTGGPLLTAWDRFLQLESQSKPSKTAWGHFLELSTQRTSTTTAWDYWNEQKASQSK